MATSVKWILVEYSGWSQKMWFWSDFMKEIPLILDNGLHICAFHDMWSSIKPSIVFD